MPFPAPGDLSNLEIKPTSPASPALAGGFFTTATPGKPCVCVCVCVCMCVYTFSDFSLTGYNKILSIIPCAIQ